MNYRGFGRGRGFGPQGAHAKGPFPRPCFPPFRHAGPPRPGCPGPFMPRNPNNFYQPPLRGNPQFRPRGRGRKFYYDDNFAGLNKLPTNSECEEGIPPVAQPTSQSNNQKVENNEIDCMPQLLPDSEERQQQNVIETTDENIVEQNMTETETDQLKQELCFSNDENWTHDASFSCQTVDNDCIDNENTFELSNESPELHIACSDVEDIDRININNSELDALQHETDDLGVTSNINNDVILGGNEDRSELETMPSHQVTDLENMTNDNACIEAEKFHESDDGPYNLEQSDLCEDNNFENELLQTDLQYDTPGDNIMQDNIIEDNIIEDNIVEDNIVEDNIVEDNIVDQCGQQQDMSEKYKIHLETDVIQEQDMLETPVLQDMPLPYDSGNQNILQENILQNEEEPMVKLKAEETALSSCVDAKNSNNNNRPLSQPSPANIPTLNSSTPYNQRRLLRKQENSFHTVPPKLSPHTELQLPIDFDPSTPPPILLKEQLSNLQSFPVYNLPPMFNPTEPPPNMRPRLFNPKVTNVPPNVPPNVRPNAPPWNINENQMPGAFNNMEMHRDLNVPVACTSQQQLPLEMSNQNNVFLPPHLDTINYSPMFPLLPSGHGIENVSPVSHIQQVPHNTYLPSASPPELLPFSDSTVDVFKDDGLNDIEEAMEFAKQMTNMTEKKEESLTFKNFNLIKIVSDVDSISLPPGKPRVKSKKPKKNKQGDDTSNKDIVLEEQTVSSEEMIQETSFKSTSDESVVITEERPKVVFNLNNKLKKVSSNWELRVKNPNRSSKTRSEKTKEKKLQSAAKGKEACAISLVERRKKVDNILRRNKAEGQMSTRDESNSENAVSSVRQSAAAAHKKIERSVEKSLHSGVSVQRQLRNRVEKIGNPSTETSWKNKIVNRFLKMSKNEIYNMVNNTSLRKFDVIMKRLVREKRSMLSLEMRHAQGEKMRQYDQQEFMNQLNAMLQPGATVGITDLPTEFIHHLNEVLQLDVSLYGNEELTVTSSISQSDPEGTSNVINPVTQTSEFTSKVTSVSDVVDQECARNKNCMARASVHEKDPQSHNLRINDFAKDDAHSTKSNKSSASSKLSALQHDLDDIFSEVRRKNQIPTATARKDCSMPQRTKRSDDGAILRNTQKAYLEEDRVRRTENCVRWIEKCDKWKMKEQEDPLAYRNLTKEEWEAKYGVPAIPEHPPAIISTVINPTVIPSSTTIPTPAISLPTIPFSTVLKQTGDGRISPDMMHKKDLYPRRRHSSESSKHSYGKHKGDDKHKRQHRRHSDERREVAENSYKSRSSSSNSNSSSSSSSKSSSKSSSSDTNTNVTKLLRVIKEKEKMAKQMSLNETIRDEVNAEIERERKQKSKKSKKIRKSSKSRKEKKRHKKSKKQKKKQSSSSDSTSQEENEEEATRLLTESEIKKEIIDEEEGMIVKEEIDGQEETYAGQEENNIRCSEFANASNQRAIAKNTTTCLPVEPHSRPESASSEREMPTTAVDTAQSYSEDTVVTTSPSQLKTKAQLKQMPEVINAIDKISPSVSTGAADDDNVTDTSKCPENSKKQTANIIHSKNEPELLSVTNLLVSRSNTAENALVKAPCDEANESLQQSDTIACASLELPGNVTNTPSDKEVSFSPDVSSRAPVVVASASPTSDATSTTSTASSQKQGTSKKIDIKTYFERTKQRRLTNKQNEPAKAIESSVTPQVSAPVAPKAVEPVKLNRNLPSSSIKDPRLCYSKRSAIASSSSTNENNTAQVTPEAQRAMENNSPQRSPKHQATERSQVSSGPLLKSEETIVAKIKLRRKSNDEKSPANVATFTAASSKSRKRPEIEENLAGKKSGIVPPDSKRFKHIRSEGSKELKLKEMAKTQKLKKPKATLKSTNLVSTIVYPSEAEDAKRTMQKKNEDNVNDADQLDSNKVAIKRSTRSASPCVNKASHNEPAKFLSENINCNDAEESPRNIEAEERFLKNLDLAESRNIKKDVANTVNIEAPARDEEARGAIVSVAIANKESCAAKEVSNDVTVESTTFETQSQVDINKTNRESLALSDESQRRCDTDPASSHTSEIKDEKFNKRNSLHNTNNDTAESDKSQPDNAEDVTGGAGKAETADEDVASALGKTAQLSTNALNEDSEEQKMTEQNVTLSPDSVGSPFKGFLQESIVAFEPSLFDLNIDEINAGKKDDELLLESSSVNCVTNTDDLEATGINTKRRNREITMISITDFAVDVNVNGKSLGIILDDVLSASDKEFTHERNEKSDSMAKEEDREKERAPKCSSPNGALASSRRENAVNASGGSNDKTEKQLESEDRYTPSTAVLSAISVGESVFINEEIQGEDGAKDLASKLTSTTDPSLSDALATTATLDEALRLPEMPPSASESLSNQMYPETTNMSAEKISCDKSPSYGAHEPLDGGEMFYLDDRLQSTGAFDEGKDDAPVHFANRRQSPPHHYDVAPVITPPEAASVPVCDLSRVETQQLAAQSKFGFAPAADDDLVRTSAKTLNILTKAALKEPKTSPLDANTSNNTTPLERAIELEKKLREVSDQLGQTWQSNVHNAKTQEFHNNTSVIAQEAAVVGKISQCGASDETVRECVNAEQSASATSTANMERNPHDSMQRTAVMEIRKIKEIDALLQKKAQRKSEKSKSAMFKSRKRENAILHKLESRRMKYRSKWPHMKNLVKKLKLRQLERPSSSTRDIILTRMMEIDVQMHELTKEKLKLHEMLQKDLMLLANSPANNSMSLRLHENDMISPRPGSPHTLRSLLIQESAKPSSPPKQPSKQSPKQPSTPSTKQPSTPSTKQPSTPSTKQPSTPSTKQSSTENRKKKRTMSHNSEDEEIVRYTQKMKTPVIRWKKIPWLDQTAAQEESEEEEHEGEDQMERRAEKQISPSACKKTNKSIDASENIQNVQKQPSAPVDHEEQVPSTSTKISSTNKKDDSDINKALKSMTWSTKNAADQSKSRDSAATEERSKSVIDKNNSLAPPETPRASSQLPNMLVRSTPEPASIYSDDSTWDSLVQNTASELHEKKKSSLALLEETFKKELAMSRKIKAIARKQKKKQLSEFLKTVNNLTVEEEELPLSKLYIKKLQQKRDLLDSLTQSKLDTVSPTIDPVIMERMDEVINAVAENRVEDLYEGLHFKPRQATLDDVLTISNVSAPDKHQFYVDAEANANADWPSVEKENLGEIALQQHDSNDTPEAEQPNFAIVNQSKVSLYNERNVEPNSSVTPEESHHSSDCCERARSADVLRNFDIKVSVPKTSIQGDFNLGLLQRFNHAESNDVAGSGLIDSTTDEFTIKKLEGSKQCDDVAQRTPPSTELAVAMRDGSEENSGAKSPEQNRVDVSDDKHVAETCELQKQKTSDSMGSTQSVPRRAGTSKTTYSTENEDSGDSAIRSAYGKTRAAATDIERNSTSSDFATAKIDVDKKKLNAESEQLSNDSVASRRDYRNVERQEEDRSNTESNSRATFEEIRRNEQRRAGSLGPVNSASEKSEESNEEKHIPDHTTTSSSSNLSSDKSVSMEATKKPVGRKRYNKNITALRRSSRYFNENVKPSKDDENSNSSGQDLNVQERDLKRRSRSPMWLAREERNTLNAKKNRGGQKNVHFRRALVGVESESENSMKSNPEPAASRDKTTPAERKRKQYTQREMMNCKVMLIDCKYTLKSENLNPEILNRVGMVYVNPYAQNNMLCPDVASIPQEKNSSLKVDSANERIKSQSEVEIVSEKLVIKGDDDELVQVAVSPSQEMEVEEIEPARTQYTVHKGPILDIKVFKNSFLAASEDSKIYRYSQTSNGILNIYKGHKSAVTCLLFYNSSSTDDNSEHMYSGSLDGTLRCYNIQTGAVMKNPAQIGSPVQCMDEAWGMIFVGTKSGHVARYNIKAGAIKGSSISFSDTSVLALKATNEGPRKILIVASRNQPISIRDAQNGLFLRTISGQRSLTVYSLMRHHNLIYCGTSSTSINVFDFTLGEQTIQYDAGVGIVCMRLYGQLLFAGCYDGNIYVFDTRNHKLVCSIPGPGNMLLSIEVVNNKIIAGSKDKRLHSWQMPPQVRALL